jgi:hypothetical protein
MRRKGEREREGERGGDRDTPELQLWWPAIITEEMLI